MTINEIQDEVIEEFADFDDWMDKYQMLIDLGNDLGTLNELAYRVGFNTPKYFSQCFKKKFGVLPGEYIK
jgi:AraC-like DNA-binding protein